MGQLPVTEPTSLELIQIRGEQALMSQRLDSSIIAMTGHLAVLQGDMTLVKDRLEQVVHHQGEFSHHSSGLERLGRLLDKLEAESQRRWEAHEAANKIVADKVTGHSTGIRVTWALFGVIAAVLTMLANVQISRIDGRMNDHISTTADVRRGYEARFTRNEADIRLLQDQRGVLSK